MIIRKKFNQNKLKKYLKNIEANCLMCINALLPNVLNYGKMYFNVAQCGEKIGAMRRNVSQCSTKWFKNF